MKCNQCAYDNEPDANFCRQCGSELTFVKPSVAKEDKVEFVSGRSRVEDNLCFGQEEDREAGWIIGAVFIILGLFIAIVMLFPEGIGDFFGNFGEFFGQLGNDIGNFFGHWGSSFGESVGNFFSNLFNESNIWNIIKILIPALFIIPGIIVIITNIRRK